MKAAKTKNKTGASDDEEEWSDDDKYDPKLTKEQLKEKKD